MEVEGTGRGSAGSDGSDGGRHCKVGSTNWDAMATGEYKAEEEEEKENKLEKMEKTSIYTYLRRLT